MVGRKWWVLISPDPDTSDLSTGAGLDYSSVVEESTPSVKPVDFDSTPAAGEDFISYDLKGVMENTTSQIMNISFWFHEIFPGIVEENNRLVRNKKIIYSFIQEEGEIVFVPSGWQHAVLNLESSVAITHNFVSRSNKTYFLSWIYENLDDLNLTVEEYRECVQALEENK